MNAITSYLQEAQSGVVPSDIEVYVAGHKGPDPSNPDVLCSQSATERLVRSRHFCDSFYIFLLSNMHVILM